MTRTTRPEATDLVDVQRKQVDDLSERLGILNEVVAKRQEECESLKHELMTVQSQLSATKRQGEREAMQQKQAVLIFRQEHEEQIEARQQEVNKRLREADASRQQAEQLKEESRRTLLSLQSKEMEFQTLAQDRIDTAKLKHQAEDRMQEAGALWGKAQEANNQATAKLFEAQTIQAACEGRNQDMLRQWDKLRMWEEELRVRARDIEIRERAVSPVPASEPTESLLS